MIEQTKIQTGNAEFDAEKGWFVGSFIDKKLGLRSTKDVEIKWAVHSEGEERPEWVTGEVRTAIAISDLRQMGNDVSRSDRCTFQTWRLCHVGERC